MTSGRNWTQKQYNHNTMDKQIFEDEYRARLISKMNALSEDDCTCSHEEYLAYKEGWRAAFMLAEDIFHRMFADITWIGVEPSPEFQKIMDAGMKNND